MKKSKNKGPIRIEAIVPLLALSLVFVGYCLFFLDLQLRWTFEWVLGRANSAQVDIARLHTKFFPPTLVLEGLAVTSPERPEWNRLECERIEFLLNGDALLRGKFVVEKATAEGWNGGNRRQKPGRVYPVIASNPDTPVGKLWVRLKDEASQTGLGQLAQLLQGFDPRQELQGILAGLGDLPSLQKMRDLEKQLNTRSAQWGQQLQKLPGPAELGAIQQKIQSLSVGGNPAQVAAQVAQATSLVQEAQALTQAVQTQTKILQDDVQSVAQQAGAVPEWVAQDTRDLEGRVKLPKLDRESISAQLMGPKLLGVLALVEPYLHQSSSVSDGHPSRQEISRSWGRRYEFGRLKDIPAFWLKMAHISGRLGAGRVQGEVRNWSSQPTWIGVAPSVSFDAQAFPLQGLQVVQSEALGLSVSSANLQGAMRGQFEAETLRVKGQFSLSDAVYESRAVSPLLSDFLQETTRSLKRTELGFEMRGPWSSPQIQFYSSIGDALEKAVRSRLEAQVSAVRAEIQKQVQQRVGAQRKALEVQLASATGVALSEIIARQKQSEAVVAQAQSKLSQAQAQAQRSAVGGLKQKLPF